MELNLFIFLRCGVPTAGEVWPKEEASEVGDDALALSVELCELCEEPVVFGVW